MAVIEILQALREYAGQRHTVGLDDPSLERFIALDPSLGEAIEVAWATHTLLRDEYADLLAGDELELAQALQEALLLLLQFAGLGVE